MEQLLLAFPKTPSHHEDDFFVTRSNQAAFQALTQNPLQGVTLLLGKRGSGKSHLAAIARKRHGGFVVQGRKLARTMVRLEQQAGKKEISKKKDILFSILRNFPCKDLLIVEDIDALVVDSSPHDSSLHVFLFHALQYILLRDGPCLLTSTYHPLDLHFACLPKDISSRLTSVDMLHLEDPDDMLLSCVLAKQLHDHHMHIQQKPLTFFARRMERSLHEVQIWAERIHHHCASTRRSLSIHTLASLINKAMGQNDAQES